MDPNANLLEQLELAHKIAEAGPQDSGGYADRLAELVFALNEWIKRGGSLPDVWKPR